MGTVRAADDETRGDGVHADPVRASLHGQLTRHAEDRGLVRRVGKRRQALEADLPVERRHVHNDAAAGDQVRPCGSRHVEDEVDLFTPNHSVSQLGITEKAFNHGIHPFSELNNGVDPFPISVRQRVTAASQNDLGIAGDTA